MHLQSTLCGISGTECSCHDNVWTSFTGSDDGYKCSISGEKTPMSFNNFKRHVEWNSRNENKYIYVLNENLWLETNLATFQSGKWNCTRCHDVKHNFPTRFNLMLSCKTEENKFYLLFQNEINNRMVGFQVYSRRKTGLYFPNIWIWCGIICMVLCKLVNQNGR